MKEEEWLKMEIGEQAYPTSNSVVIRVPNGWVYADMHGVCFIPILLS